MSKTNQFIVLAVFIIFITAILVVSDFLHLSHYREGFAQVEIGQSKEEVMNLMGKPDETRNCNFPIYDGNRIIVTNCAKIFDYYGVGEEWAVAFDRSGNVIEKYNGFLGEYRK